MNKILPIIFNWVLSELIVPLIHFLGDSKKLLEKKVKANQAAKELKDAKSNSDIDRAIDNLP